MSIFIVVVIILHVCYDVETACNTIDNIRQVSIYPPNESNPNPSRQKYVYDRFISCVPRHIQAVSLTAIVVLTFRISEININLWRFIECGILKKADENISRFRYAFSERET